MYMLRKTLGLASKVFFNIMIVLFGIANVNGKGENNVNIQHGLIKMSGALPYNFGFQLMPYVNENKELGIYVQSLSDEMYAAQRLSYGTLPVLKVGDDISGEVMLSIYTEGAGGDFMIKSVGGLSAAEHYGPVPENMFELSSELFGEYGLNEQTEFPSADYSDGVAAGGAQLGVDLLACGGHASAAGLIVGCHRYAPSRAYSDSNSSIAAINCSPKASAFFSPMPLT